MLVEGVGDFLEYMLDAAMSAVMPLGVRAVELALKLPSMVYAGDVEVVVYGAVGVAYPVEALSDLAEEGTPLLAVGIVQIDGLSPVAMRGNAAKPRREIQHARGGTCVAATAANIAMQDP